jgi:hypothetical protein
MCTVCSSLFVCAKSGNFGSSRSPVLCARAAGVVLFSVLDLSAGNRPDSVLLFLSPAWRHSGLISFCRRRPRPRPRRRAWVRSSRVARFRSDLVLSVSGFHFRAPRPGLVAKHCSTGMFLPDLSVRRRRSIFLLLKARIQLPLTVFLSGFFLTAQRAGPRAKISVCS